jgi:hypothetical protein
MWHTDWHVTAQQASTAVFEKSYELAEEWNMNLKTELSFSQNKDRKTKKSYNKKYVRGSQNLQNRVFVKYEAN